MIIKYNINYYVKPNPTNYTLTGRPAAADGVYVCERVCIVYIYIYIET